MIRRQQCWVRYPEQPHLVDDLSRRHSLPALVAQIIMNRGLADPDDIEAFLDPSLNRLLPPAALQDMDRAVQRLVQAVERREPVAVYGDYDVDGVTATALLVDFFRSLGLPAISYIPDRLTQGYGLHTEALVSLAEKVKLLVTVDCGISNSAEVAAARENGLEIIVTDHHNVPEELPAAVAVIDPKRPDSDYGFKELAGVGVALNLVLGLRAALREQGWFRSRPEPNLKAYLDLVALGTAADVVPLTGVNRILACQGLKVLSTTLRPGLVALKEIARLNDRPVSLREVVFRLAPRLNAAGRMGMARGALELLLADSREQAHSLATHLDGLNQKRQSIEKDILKQADKQIRQAKWQDDPALVVAGEGWHPGVIGIVAARLANAYYRPVVLISLAEGLGRGSARSIEPYNLYAGLKACRRFFIQYGGHRAAAGFTMSADQIPAFREAFQEVVIEQLGRALLTPSLRVDAEAELEELTEDFFHHLERLRPFGQGNPEPVLTCPEAEVLSSRVVGENHLRIHLAGNSRVMEAIAFGRAGCHPLTGLYDIAFTPRLSYYQGRPQPELQVLDLGRAGG